MTTLTQTMQRLESDEDIDLLISGDGVMVKFETFGGTLTFLTEKEGTLYFRTNCASRKYIIARKDVEVKAGRIVQKRGTDLYSESRKDRHSICPVYREILLK